MKSRISRAEKIELITASMPWEDVREDLLDAEDAATFKHRKQAVTRYLTGEPLEQINVATGVGGNFLRKIINRCLTIAPDGLPYGYRALIKNRSIKDYVRNKKECLSSGSKNSGMAGILGQTFHRYAELQEALDAYILKVKVVSKDNKAEVQSKDKKKEIELEKFCNRPKDVHKKFIELLKSYHHPETEWPFNTNFLGIRTITTYVKELQNANSEKVVRMNGDAAKIAHLSVGTGKVPLVGFRDFNDCWMIDSHTYDHICTIEILNDQGAPSFVPVTRLHVLLILEPLSRACVWYRVVYGGDVTANDISALVRQALSKVLPKPVEVIPNLAPDPGAGFVAEMFPELAQSPPSFISLDNAWAHFGDRVCIDLRKETGCAFDYGAPKKFERRALIESRFGVFESVLSHRMRSTVGSGPGKGRAKDAIEASIKFRITSDVLEHLTYVTFANFNVQSSEGLRFSNPKQVIEHYLSKRDSHFLPRVLPADKLALLGTALVREKVFIRASPRPFINFEKVRYRFTNPDRVVQLIGQQIIIEVNESDIRGFNAFLLNGEPLGWMTAESYWGEQLHSRKTRISINRLKHRRVQEFVNGGNLIKIYTNFLISEANRQSAAELDRLRHEISRATGESVENPVKKYTDSSAPLEQHAEAPPAASPASGWVASPLDIDIYDLLKKIR
ncbi:hypothetical protein [Pseudomonas silesiensis]|uniref:hypothetical protein n=1 Tax=Pseudomonas silesiensis TaxID=1853130 RepID=UPI0034D5A022